MPGLSAKSVSACVVMLGCVSGCVAYLVWVHMHCPVQVTGDGGLGTCKLYDVDCVTARLREIMETHKRVRCRASLWTCALLRGLCFAAALRGLCFATALLLAEVQCPWRDSLGGLAGCQATQDAGGCWAMACAGYVDCA